MRRGLLVQLDNGCATFLCPLISAQVTIGLLQSTEQVPSIGHLKKGTLHGNQVDLVVPLQRPVVFAQHSPAAAAGEQRIRPRRVRQIGAQHGSVLNLLKSQRRTLWLVGLSKEPT